MRGLNDEAAYADDTGLPGLLARLTDDEPLDRRSRAGLLGRLAVVLARQGRRLVDSVVDIAPHIPVIDKSKREDGTFSREDFTFYEEGNIYICPAFNILTSTGKIMNDDLLFYRASTRD